MHRTSFLFCPQLKTLTNDGLMPLPNPPVANAPANTMVKTVLSVSIKSAPSLPIVWLPEYPADESSIATPHFPLLGNRFQVNYISHFIAFNSQLKWVTAVVSHRLVQPRVYHGLSSLIRLYSMLHRDAKDHGISRAATQ